MCVITCREAQSRVPLDHVPTAQANAADSRLAATDFGEMTLWWGIWFLSIAVLRDGYWVSVVSPLFVMLLILKGSGVPMQETQVRCLVYLSPATSRH